MLHGYVLPMSNVSNITGDVYSVFKFVLNYQVSVVQYIFSMLASHSALQLPQVYFKR